MKRKTFLEKQDLCVMALIHATQEIMMRGSVKAIQEMFRF